MRQSPISYSTLSQLLTLYVYIGPKAVGLSYSNIGKFQGKFNTANPQTRNKKPSNKNKKKPLKKPSLKSTFAPTKEEIDRRPIVFFDITIDGVPAGTVFFELFNETVPKTAENFRILSTGTQWGQTISVVLAIIFVFFGLKVPFL